MRHRMHSICPYLAMFPEDFVFEHANEYTAEGDRIFDPFSGRGTTLFQSLLMKRKAAAVDVNPVAYCISKAKAQIPSLDRVQDEIDRLEKLYGSYARTSLDEERRKLPPFFRRAYYHTTLRQMLYLRKALKWRVDPVHGFVTALALGSLHGESDKSRSYFSNQMPRTISTKPAYSLKYWRENNLWPHKRDVFAILRARAEYRLANQEGVRRGSVALADARLAAHAFPQLKNSVSAVITSPPYLNMLRYEEDQWLRLWFLGSKPHPVYGKYSRDDRHTSAKRYWSFLAEVWEGMEPLLKKESVMVCRIGAVDIKQKELTVGLKASLKEAFPNVEMLKRPKVSQIKNRQADHFLPGSKGCTYEVDYVFALKKAA
jgi:hypothetical protein